MPVVEISFLYFAQLLQQLLVNFQNLGFEICWSWKFQNTPYMSNLTMFWRRYLRLKTHDTILLFSWYLLINCSDFCYFHLQQINFHENKRIVWSLTSNISARTCQIGHEGGVLILSGPYGFQICPRFWKLTKVSKQDRRAILLKEMNFKMC